MRKMKGSGLGWVGAIPSDWDVVPQKHLMYKTKSICKHWNNEPILSLTTGGVIVRDIENGKGKFPASFDGYQNLEPGNLLLCLFDMDVTPRCVGLVRVAGVTSPAYSQFAMKPGASARFYDYYLRAMDDQKLYVPLTSTLRHSFTEETFGQIPAVMPPLDEQRRIADYLDARCADIDAAVDAAERSVDEYKAYQRSLIYEAVTGKNLGKRMTNSGVEWLGVVPADWEMSYIGLRFNINKRIAGKGGYDILSITQQGLKVKDITKGEGQIAADYSNYQLVEPGDFAMNHMDLLTGWIDLSHQEGVTSPDYRVFTPRDSNMCPEYYLYLFQTYYSARIFYGYGRGISHMGRWRLPADNFKKIPITIPPLDEQQSIATYLDSKCAEIQGAVAAKQSIIADLKDYKQSLIYEVVTGKREVS